MQVVLRDATGGEVKEVGAFDFCRAKVVVVDAVPWPIREISAEALPSICPKETAKGCERSPPPSFCIAPFLMSFEPFCIVTSGQASSFSI